MDPADMWMSDSLFCPVVPCWTHHWWMKSLNPCVFVSETWNSLLNRCTRRLQKARGLSVSKAFPSSTTVQGSSSQSYDERSTFQLFLLTTTWRLVSSWMHDTRCYLAPSTIHLCKNHMRLFTRSQLSVWKSEEATVPETKTVKVHRPAANWFRL